ncbi:chorismate-binding protein [Prosthecobacter sp.]|uniref:chorismate-binding protein n=1 Tax=Prosthecobacter sp. TaxID=1965333 RepID=UPI002ABBBEEB|nr:chorismate-binding protein [Prosthecobacter sp.]MDZ4404782.1 chorismate-binding protein [Prosthecobacter sp.]
MMEFALFRLPDGRAWLGEGPFTALAAAPAAGGAFYINDFDLSDPKPWKVPAKLHAITAESLAKTIHLNGAATPQIHWAKPATEWFKMAFRRIRREVLAKRIEKMVPVLTESGTLTSGDPRRLLDAIMKAPENMWGYAHVKDSGGFLGATPELLFTAKGHDLETMALAGTAKPGNQDAFLTDVKEIEEHEIVVRYLADRLQTLGKVTRLPRSLCQTSGLVHFQSKLSVKMRETADPAQLVPLLHPTPAVGCLPRDDASLAKLREYRQQLKVPGFFGAPFGFIESDGTTHIIVAIRGICWEGDKISLPSGCGIVGGSAFDHEWRELRLKREAVLRLLALHS